MRSTISVVWTTISVWKNVNIVMRNVISVMRNDINVMSIPVAAGWRAAVVPLLGPAVASLEQVQLFTVRVARHERARAALLAVGTPLLAVSVTHHIA